jgi:hypothetical protein
MAYTTADARQQLLDSIAEAAEQLSVALSSLSEVYEGVDELTAESVEEGLFRPVQVAYGRARRAHGEFAERYGLPGRAFAEPVVGAPGRGVKGFIDSAVAAIGAADQTLATLQDSMLPVEVGDTRVRADLEHIRSLLGGLGLRARELERKLGR